MPTIAENHLMPVICRMLAQFPFRLLGFHSDNGSEYVSHRVALMLEKLRVEFTRGHPRRSNDNGLAETKNGGVVRKRIYRPADAMTPLEKLARPSEAHQYLREGVTA